MCFNENNVARIDDRQQCPPATVWGIGGKEIIVGNGKSIVNNDTPAYARTVVATDRRGSKLWLIVVDGKQPFYSEGANLKEVAAIAIGLGADSALNLDGGGSTTLAVASDSGSKILNAPIHGKIPMVEHPIANHLGFYERVKTGESRSH